MNSIKITKQELTNLLLEAKTRHAEHEKRLGMEDENWASWYAEFILERLQPENVVEGGEVNANAGGLPLKVTKPIPESFDMSEPLDVPGENPTEPEPSPTPEQRANQDSSSAFTCPTCGHRNRPGTLVCENCGTMLTTGAQPVGTRDLRDEELEQTETSQEDASRRGTAILPDVNETSSALSTGEAKAVMSAGSAVFESNMVLRIEIEGGTTPILLHPKQQRDMILGRRDPTTGGMPDVDLTPYAGYRMGVSRRHSAMRLQDKQLDVWDLGSSNGTFLNGTRLNPHRPYRLKDGDEVRLGQMVLRVYFQADTAKP